jgi:uncharacterized protein YneF (UPF0154 family)
MANSSMTSLCFLIVAAIITTHVQGEESFFEFASRMVVTNHNMCDNPDLSEDKIRLIFGCDPSNQIIVSLAPY